MAFFRREKGLVLVYDMPIFLFLNVQVSFLVTVYRAIKPCDHFQLLAQKDILKDKKMVLVRGWEVFFPGLHEPPGEVVDYEKSLIILRNKNSKATYVQKCTQWTNLAILTESCNRQS